MSLSRFLSLFVIPGLVIACDPGVAPNGPGSGGAGGETPASTTSITTTGGSGGDGGDGGGGTSSTGFAEGGAGTGGAETCTGVTSEAELVPLPVDIIWVVDNSSSMEPAIAQVKAGLNDFAGLISASSLDYKVILLSHRGSADLSICIPPPLAGDAACGNGPRFFHSSIDILSTQPLEQFLGTLGQTEGYKEGQSRGGEPWADQLRPEATKTIVIVTDDNARLSATQFQTFAGGQNPFNSLMLPPGILHPSYGGLFDDYIFSGIYGWGDMQDPSVICEYPDLTTPPSAGLTYTTLVNNTGGVRAKICDGSAAWGPFFSSVAQAVLQASQIECTLAIPPPPPGETLDFAEVNVQLVSGSDETLIPNVGGESGCGGDEGWYYDDADAPTSVVLCAKSCDDAQELAGPNQPGKVEVLFGCATIVE